MPFALLQLLLVSSHPPLIRFGFPLTYPRRPTAAHYALCNSFAERKLLNWEPHDKNQNSCPTAPVLLLL